jgi:histidyl-tRNA synthetase
MRVKRPRGTRDFLPPEMEERRYLEAKIREVFESYGYREIITPTFESLELITAKSGEEIRERLYHFKDKSGRELVLRPELTAPAMRLYVNQSQFEPKPVRLYYLGNCFRYERPQSGRYREFWQAGIELIGSPYPEAEGEIVAVAFDVLRKIGLNFELHIGHIGILRQILKESGIMGEEQNVVMSAIDKGGGLEELLDGLGLVGDDRRRLLDILALVGSKEEVIERARTLLDGLEEATLELSKLEELLRVLEGYQISPYLLNLGIARGLDYYSGMVFEIYAPKLGAEKQICGGGSYSLAETFGGKGVPTVGFAFGFDRVHLALKKDKSNFMPSSRAKCLIVATGENLLNDAVKVSRMLRTNNFCELELTRKTLKKALSYADQRGFTHVAIVGDEELEVGCVALRDMASGEQRKIKLGELADLKLEVRR